MDLQQIAAALLGPTGLLAGCLLALIGRWRGWWIDGPTYSQISRDKEALENENKKLTSMIIAVARNADGVQDMQEQLARMLRGD